MDALNLSYWEKESFYAADVIIVGCGIVGLNAAIAIKKQQQNLTVILLERGFLPSGASTKNAGFACFGSVSELIAQEKSSGTAQLHQLIKKRWQGLQKLRDIVGDKRLSLQTNGGFELFKPSEAILKDKCVSKISHFNAMVKDITGTENVFSVANQKLEPFGFKGADCLIENKLEAQLNAGKMIKSLIEIAASVGVIILNNCSVNSFTEEGNNTSVFTSQGKFCTKKLLFCNNAFANQLFPQLKLKPGRGQIMVTSPIKDLKFKGTFHYNEGYYYFRNIGNRVLLGGGRNLDFFSEETHQFGETPLVQNALLSLLKEVILPHQAFEIEYKWSGIMAFGPALWPIIEPISKNVFCAVRCNGMGIAIGSQTGQEAADMVLQSL